MVGTLTKLFDVYVNDWIIIPAVHLDVRDLVTMLFTCCFLFLFLCRS